MAFSAGTGTKTEFGGEYKVATYLITPDAATGNVDLSSDFDSVIVIGVHFTEDADLASTCIVVQAEVDGTTASQVNFSLWNTSGTAASTFPEIRLTVIGTKN